MKPNPVHRLPAPLESAVQRLKLAAREAAERTIESLGLAALASTNAYQRDGLLGAQFELNRKSAVFVLTFNDAFDELLLREVGPAAAADPAPAAAAVPTSWDALSLVENSEVEAQISADRFGMEIAHGCEWELRELHAYVGSLLGDVGGASERNPLRPDLIGHAMMRGIGAVSDRPEIRKVLVAEMSRSLGNLLPAAYAAVVADLRQAGVQPMSLAVRNRPARAGAGDESGRDDSSLGSAPDEQGHGSPWSEAARRGPGTHGGAERGPGARRSGAGAYSPSTRSGFPGTQGGTPIGQVDPALMALIRRLAFTDRGAQTGSPGAGEYVDAGDHGWSGGTAEPLPNLIRAHREELRQASRGTLDHMVIDVIGFLFDQILADPKVPPQMARQIARLQLPVLRAALGDPTFFSSRRHPVRRFVNRIASLGAAFEDFGSEEARGFLAKVRELVNDVVEGDFEQIEIYQQKLAALEAFTAQQASDGTWPQGDAAALLAEKEDQLRLRQLYAQRLAGDLKDVAAPAFLRDFISRVWSRVLLRAAEQGGADGPLAQRLRRAGRELFLSVQPKPTPTHRKTFLAELPKLMQEINEGMNLIGWPEAQRRAFFGQLMPAHAEALKSPAGRQLDINMMARQIEGALERPLPSSADLKAAAATLPVLTDEIEAPSFSADEAQRVGLVDESAVDWDGQVDIEIGTDAEAEGAEAGVAIPGLPSPGEPPEPTQGKALADHVQLGFAYQMHLGGQWQKVRLSHVSPGRSFFIFTHGSRHKQTVSLTQRMLARLAETGRLRAFENASLIDRATARARRQLAALRSSA
ncbi:MAG: DUF1631 family protein [Betaproteobacteria bacterium]|nr:DUF1631 family protein [Betaproteobacteria bacterium]MBK8106078.1 DUF1631 family protein [Betaproteobacteria bacterium]